MYKTTSKINDAITNIIWADGFEDKREVELFFRENLRIPGVYSVYNIYIFYIILLLYVL